MVNWPRAVRGPGERLLGARLARGHLHPVGDHEGGVEADAELADQAGPLLGLGRGQRRAERAGAGAGDGAQVVDQLLAAHADAVVGDQQRAGALVGHDADLGLGGRRERGVGQRLEAAPVHRIGGVGHQLAQEDFPLGIERVHHEVEQPPDLGAEIMLFRHRIVHRLPSLRAAICSEPGSVSMRRRPRTVMRATGCKWIPGFRSTACVPRLGYEGWNWSTKRTARQH